MRAPLRACDEAGIRATVCVGAQDQGMHFYPLYEPCFLACLPTPATGRPRCSSEDGIPLPSTRALRYAGTLTHTLRRMDMTTLSSFFKRLSASQRGILWMLLTMLLFATTNVIAKYLAEDYAIPQVVWARFTFYALFLVLLLRRRLPAAMATKRPGLQLARSVLMICVSTLYFTTLHIMPLADASAVLHTSPLLITAFSAPLLGERVSFRRWLAVAIGFAAVLVVIRPGADVLRLVVIVPLTAVSLQALFEIATRILGRTEPTLTTVVYTPLVGTVVVSAVVPFFWLAPRPEDWGLMVALGLLSLVSQFTLIKAYEAAPAATVASFAYTGLIWATLYGFLVFSQLPDFWTVLGATIVCASGLYIFRDEQRDQAADGR